MFREVLTQVWDEFWWFWRFPAVFLAVSGLRDRAGERDGCTQAPCRLRGGSGALNRRAGCGTGRRRTQGTEGGGEDGRADQ